MKATKTLKNAIKDYLRVTEKDYDVIYMARIYDDSDKWYDVAVINIFASNDAIVIRAWKTGGVKCREIEKSETMNEAFIKFINLDK